MSSSAALPTPRTIEVTASSRLHFGMFSFGHADRRQFGGVGAMISPPGLQLRVSPARQFETAGPLASRVAETALRVARALALETLPACRVEVLSSPPQHVGLGTGTQIDNAVAAALNALLQGKSLEPEALVALSGRAARSAVGTYGFVHGGLLVERGKLPHERLSPLEERLELPPAWRFVLIAPARLHGLSGEAEQSAFGRLPPVPCGTTERLWDEVRNELLPAARTAEFERFSSSLYRFGFEAGQCFAAGQGGAFASPEIAELVGTVRRLGVLGVGQSSWGPTVFALLEDEAEAAEFASLVQRQISPQAEVVIAAPDNQGARIKVH